MAKVKGINPRIKISGLPENGNFLLLWTGNSTRNKFNPQETQITLQFAELLNFDPGKELKLDVLDSSSIKLLPKACYANVKYIPILRIGSVFNQGRRVVKSLFKTFDVELSAPNNIKEGIVKFEDIFQEKSELKEAFKFYLHTRCLKFNGINSDNVSEFKIKGLDNQKLDVKSLIIPCYEVARFYFLRSDNLTQVIYDKGFEKEYKIFHREESILLSKELGYRVIVLGDGMLFSDAPVIYRMMFNRTVRALAGFISEKFIEHYHNTGKAGFFCRIPYDEDVKLQVSGYFINTAAVGEPENIVFVACQIIFHENQWDFNDLKVLKLQKGKRSKSDKTPDKKEGRVHTTPHKDTLIVADKGNTYNAKEREFIVSDEEEEQNFNELNVDFGHVNIGDNENENNTEYKISYYEDQMTYSLLDEYEKEASLVPRSHISINNIKRDEYRRNARRELDDVLLNFINSIEDCALSNHLQIQFKAHIPNKINSKFTFFPKDSFGKRDSQEFKWCFTEYNHVLAKWELERTAVLVEVQRPSTKDYCYFLRIRPRYSINDISLRLFRTVGNSKLSDHELTTLLEDVVILESGSNAPTQILVKSNVEMYRERISSDTPLNQYSNKLNVAIKKCFSNRDLSSDI